MAGTSQGFAKVSLAGARVANIPTYTPAHSKNGQTIQANLKVRVCINTSRGKENYFDLALWGKAADSGAKALSRGKEINIDGTLKSYEGRIWVQNPADPKGRRIAAQDAAGNPITITKTEIKVDQIKYGADSDKTIDSEIQAGLRPPNWNIKGHQDAQTWSNMCKLNNSKTNSEIKNGVEMFGHARVRKVGEMPVVQQNLQAQVANAVNNPGVNAAFSGVQNFNQGSAMTAGGPFPSAV